MLKEIKMILNREKKLIDVWHYILGNYRYFIISRNWYNNDSRPPLWNRLAIKLIRKHIQEQIRYRIEWMDKECYDSGSCKICGCETIALQMANKACDKPCYPEMMTEENWEGFKMGNKIRDKYGVWHQISVFKQLGKPLLSKTKYDGFI